MSIRRPAEGPSGFFGFFKKDKTDPTLVRIREACTRHSRSTFRVYRTCAGYRVLATDLSLDPKSQATQDFLASFGFRPRVHETLQDPGKLSAPA